MRTARRRWSRELPNEVDGIAVGEGPVLVHGYDPPAGGKWVDDVIPGKLGALAPDSGETLWLSPCEVGYGRGFGAGFGAANDVIVLGPSVQGHRAVRMSIETGELVEAQEIDAFDEAIVEADLCHLVTATQITALSTPLLHEAWSFKRKGERYHMIARDGDRLFVVYTNIEARKQGVTVLDATSGEPRGEIVPPEQTVIHTITAGSGSVTFLLTDLFAALSEDAIRDYLIANPDAEISPSGKLWLVCHAGNAKTGDPPRWFDTVEGLAADYPDVVISHDSGKLYVVQGASVDTRDLMTGTVLGEVTVPGLDEHVSWKIFQGAGVLAEETRLSIFEISD